MKESKMKKSHNDSAIKSSNMVVAAGTKAIEHFVPKTQPMNKN